MSVTLESFAKKNDFPLVFEHEWSEEITTTGRKTAKLHRTKWSCMLKQPFFYREMQAILVSQPAKLPFMLTPSSGKTRREARRNLIMKIRGTTLKYGDFSQLCVWVPQNLR